MRTKLGSWVREDGRTYPGTSPLADRGSGGIEGEPEATEDVSAL